MNERVYVQTNDAEKNEVVAFGRSGDGRLDPLGRYETGGRGTGEPHLASQSSIVAHRRRRLAARRERRQRRCLALRDRRRRA